MNKAKIFEVDSRNEKGEAQGRLYVAALTFKEATVAFKKAYKNLEPYRFEHALERDKTSLGMCLNDGNDQVYDVSYHLPVNETGSIIGSKHTLVAASSLLAAGRALAKALPKAKIFGITRKHEKVLVA